MNDRELHCRGKASEARTKARVAPNREDQREHLEAAKEWEREGDKAADAYAAPYPPGEGTPNHAS